jgi:thiol-disulfide isomerase/thioredoxin
MRRASRGLLLGLVLSYLLAACFGGPSPGGEETNVQSEVLLSLPDLGTAPEFRSDVWLNVDKPLRLAELRGKVVLLDMWTFGCINCQRVIPSLREWHERYREQGLVVIGNHYPEFADERSLANLEEALVRLDVPYPVAQDNEREVWSDYGTLYWPTLYLIDKRGHLRYSHIGEGSYAEIEGAIQLLISEG